MIRLRPNSADEILIKRVRDWYEPGPGVLIEPQSLFSPAMLFTGSTVGVWYDPSDFSTLYQDAASTTPVTAVEQPVGLMLDKSKGLVLGPELVTNGDFSNGTTGWGLGAGWSIVDGQAVRSPSSFGSVLQQPISINAGKTYKVTYTVTAYTAQNVQVIIDGGTQVLGVARSSIGTFTEYLTAKPGNATLWMTTSSKDASLTIGNISVRELPGNHAFNPSGNSANFPVLSARYNLLTKTEQFDDAAWAKTASGTGSTPAVISNAVVAPDGTLTADQIVFNRGAGNTITDYSWTYETLSGLATGASYSGSLYIQAATPGDVGKTLAIRNINSVDTLVTLTSSWQRVVSVATATGSVGSFGIYNRGTITTGGSVTVNIWGADLRVANDALNQPAYQRVNTSTDYDAVGFKPYLSFNGVNQWLQTNNIDFTYGDKMFVCAGVRKLSDAATAVAFELSASLTTNIGAFAVAAPLNNSGSTFGFASKGTAFSAWSISGASFSAPSTVVLSGIGDISGSVQTLRANASQVQNIALSQGTGNYGNHPLYIGARGGSSFFFNGRLYGLVVAGKAASASEIASTETWLNQKTGAY